MQQMSCFRGTHSGGAEPGWQATEVPLCTDVGAGAQDHQHVQLLHNANELLNVLRSVPLVLSGVALVVVPGNVELHPQVARGVQGQCEIKYK